MLLGLLLCVDILLLSAWQIFDPVQATILPFEKVSHVCELDLWTRPGGRGVSRIFNTKLFCRFFCLEMCIAIYGTSSSRSPKAGFWFELKRKDGPEKTFETNVHPMTPPPPPPPLHTHTHTHHPLDTPLPCWMMVVLLGMEFRLFRYSFKHLTLL